MIVFVQMDFLISLQAYASVSKLPLMYKCNQHTFSRNKSAK